MVFAVFLAVLLIAVLLAVASIHADLRARDRMPPAPPQQSPGPPEGVWPPPPHREGPGS